MSSNKRTEDQEEVLSIPSIPSPDSKDLSSLEKEDSECIEKAEVSPSQFDDILYSLSPSHREYLFKRHGTLDLDPMPSASDADPYNWPTWKKLTNLLLVAFHACMATFASSIAPAFGDISIDLGVSVQRASYLTTLQIAILGGAPLFWRPLSHRYPPGALIFGFVANRAGYRWIFWVTAITNGVQFILYIFFGPETRYIGGSAEDSSSDFKTQYLSFRRIDPTPLTLWEFIHPLAMAKHPCVLIPAVAYAMVFLFGSVLINVEVPQLLQEKFALNTEQLGLQFIGIIIGTVLGEQIGGVIFDYWVNRRARRIRKAPDPEFRLWLSYPGIVLTMVGLIVCLVCTQQASEGRWTVTPIVGTGVAAFGNQVVTAAMVPYAVDCRPDDAGSVGVFINFARQIWGFLGPFW
ncbi:hypothetical protein APSETT444_009280 [Aspergillus pseudonomiae]